MAVGTTGRPGHTEESDVREAIRLMNVATQRAATDPRTGAIDMDMSTTNSRGPIRAEPGVRIGADENGVIRRAYRQVGELFPALYAALRKGVVCGACPHCHPTIRMMMRPPPVCAR